MTYYSDEDWKNKKNVPDSLLQEIRETQGSIDVRDVALDAMARELIAWRHWAKT